MAFIFLFFSKTLHCTRAGGITKGKNMVRLPKQKCINHFLAKVIKFFYDRWTEAGVRGRAGSSVIIPTRTKDWTPMGTTVSVEKGRVTAPPPCTGV